MAKKMQVCENGDFRTNYKKAKYKIGEEVYFCDLWSGIKKGIIRNAIDRCSISKTSFGYIRHENPYEIESNGESYCVTEGCIARTKEELAKEFSYSGVEE